MNEKLRAFFNTAKGKADVVLSQQVTETLEEEKRKGEQLENFRVLKSKIAEEFGDIFKVLQELPENNGKRFFVDMHDHSRESDSARARIDVIVSYDKSNSFDHGVRFTQPWVSMTLTQQNGALDISITQGSMLEQEGYYTPTPRHLSVATLDEAQRELGFGIGNFAPERVEDIGNAIGALAPKTQPAVTQPAALKL